jgi:hypothetical protein
MGGTEFGRPRTCEENAMSVSAFCRDRRRAMHDRPDARFVEMDEYVGLLLSWRKMDRWDDSVGKVRGLRDLDTGMHFLIEHEKLGVR